MASKKPKFRVGRKLVEAEAATFEDRQEQRARAGLPEVAAGSADDAGAWSAAAEAALQVHEVPDSRGGASASLQTYECSDSGVPEGAIPQARVSDGLEAYGPVGPRDRRYASLQARESGHAQPEPERRGRGGWTKSNPYTRKDGTVTRSTTLYLSVDLADRLRRYAFEADRKQSDVIVEAIELLLAQKPSGRR